MARILSYSIVAEEYERLIDIDRKYKALANLIESNDPKFVTVSLIAKANKVNRYDVFNKPWLMPNFGEDGSEHEGRKKRFWRYDEYLEWIAIPEMERISMYRQLKDTQ